jgi:hypothetical protein
VLTLYQGKTRGDEVKQGQAQFKVHDRQAADSNLVAAAGVLD